MVLHEQTGQSSFTEQAVEILQTTNHVQNYVNPATNVMRKLLRATGGKANESCPLVQFTLFTWISAAHVRFELTFMKINLPEFAV